MNNENIKYILHIVPKLEMGGIGMMLLNYYKNIDKNKYCFDVVVYGEEIGSLENEFLKLGSEIFHVTPKRESFFKYRKDMNKIYNLKKYYAIHAHQNTLSFLPLMIAKKCGYKIRIAHAHECISSPTFLQKIKRDIFLILNNIYVTHYLYCGENSKKWVFGNKKNNKKNYKFIPNGINIQKFEYSEFDRDVLRKKYGIDDNTIVLITISRLSVEKNLNYVVSLVYEMKKMGKKVKYFIIGNGPKKQEIKSCVENNNLESDIIFLGEQNNCSRYYSFADVYLLPSFFEAFPVGVIEAQANKCPSILSDNVPQEVIINENVQRICIGKDNINKWINAIDFLYKKRNIEISPSIKKFDIKYLAKELENYYDSLV